MELTVTSINLNILENATTHHTECYKLVQDGSSAIFRRGQTFNFDIQLNRPFKEGEDFMKIMFKTGNIPSPSKGSSAVLIVKEVKDLLNDRWNARFKDITESSITIQVFISPDVSVGEWEMIVYPVKNSTNGYKIAIPIYILFNPWCVDDGVYLCNDEGLEEYVLNENGKIWLADETMGQHWYFGQFEKVVLLSVITLLDRAFISAENRTKPVEMARCISKIVSNDTSPENFYSLLIGKWEGSFEDSTNPNAWLSSIPIFEEFYETKSTVKYAQCKVIAGVLVSVFRALGIPCRPVTNYSSGIDKNANLAIETYIDANGKKLKNYPNTNCENKNGFWNFHVWNEVWMNRPDLPKGYGGWQSIDGALQAFIDNMHGCGPTPIKAIRDGEFFIGYDTAFAYAKVRAEGCILIETADGIWRKGEIIKNKGGRRIVTKRIGKKMLVFNDDMEDITHFYKFPYDALEDKITFLRAVNLSSKMVRTVREVYEEEKTQVQDVVFHLFEIDSISLDESFKISTSIKNSSSETRHVSIALSVSSKSYIGTTREIKTVTKYVDMKPNQGESIIHTFVKHNEYMDKLSANYLITVAAEANVKGTGQLWRQEFDILLPKPQLNITINSGQPCVGKNFIVTFSFNNPLNIVLTDCTFSVEGPGVHTISKFRDIEPKENQITIKYKFNPEKCGKYPVMGCFNSKQLASIQNTCIVIILSKN